LFDSAEYGETWAGIYDDYPAHPTAADAEPAGEFLAKLAEGGPVLEFGIGTGRIALKVAALGTSVCGMDSSRAMLDRLAVKPGAEHIRTVVGDIAKDRFAGRFSLVFAAFNTVLMLPDQERQARCFQNAANHLKRGGVFVVETFVPDFAKLTQRRSHEIKDVDDHGLWVMTMRHDPLRQLIFNEAVRIGPGVVRRYPVVLRYAFPAELDLMARHAGFRLCERYADWRRTPFTESSLNQVSVYRLDEP
jgi:SAM-dependent methyltransferase